MLCVYSRTNARNREVRYQKTAILQPTVLSSQCMSNIGQIVKSVCVCVGQWVTESLTQNESNALQVAVFHRCSPNLPPRWSWRKFGYLLFLVEILNISVHQTGSGINRQYCSHGKISTMLNISKMVTDTMLYSKDVRMETTHGLLIGTVTLNRPRSSSHDVSIKYRIRWEIQCWVQSEVR